MTKENRLFAVRRLFMKDAELIEKCYSSFDFLHFNPMKKEYIEKVLAEGQIWRIYEGEKIAGCSYAVPAQSDSFSQLDASWEICDLMDSDLHDSMVIGYLWTDDNYREYPLFSAFDRLWNIRAVRTGKKQVLYYIPAHINFSMEEIFSCGYALYGLRGLDRLVPHYIFGKSAEPEKSGYTTTDVKKCSASDTKRISMLCEHGYMGKGTDGEHNIIFTCRR